VPIGLIIVGIGAGLASALLFYSAARGSPMLGTTLLLLTPLPTLLAGLGWNWMSAAIGAAAGALVMAVVVSGSFAAGYLLALGVPAALAAYLAYLSRPDPQDAAAREWYPAGRLVAAMSLYGGALPVLILPLIGGSYDILRAPIVAFLQRLSARAPEMGWKPPDEEQIASVADFAVALLPSIFAAYWLAIFTFNLYLAGRIARASGRLGRDWPDLPALTFPPLFPLAVALALAASFAPGAVGIAGASFSGALLLAYLISGLALMHFIARGRRSAWILWLVYAALLFVQPYTAVALVTAGLLEPALNLRRRFGAPPPTST
jgi:hypothetical protein